MSGFAHLHLHSEYSLLDGACRIGKLMPRLNELGQTACAITDHGVMYGVLDFYKAARAEGIHPVIGCEVYVAPRRRFDRVHELDASPYHLVLLCEDERGYHNLCKLVSRAFTEGFYVKPRVDIELLTQYSGGLIALSACLAGELSAHLMRGDYAKARQAAERHLEIFGRDNYYLELQEHGIAEQAVVNKGLIRLSSELGIGLVATNDAHYIRRADSEMQDVLMCIQTNKTVNDTERMRFETQEFYVKSEQEMRALFPETPEAIDNTVKIAERCRYDFKLGTYHLPSFPLPEGEDHAAHLRAQAEAGFERRYPEAPPEYAERLNYELGMIERMGFVDYFLIVSDFMAYARRKGIPVGPGRGSAAGSMVSYCLNITDVDPMRYGLFFERFLNPERVSMPDIDIDFCVARRGEVIDYVVNKYGAGRVAQIITFGTMAARASIRDTGRALGYSYAELDIIAKQVPFAVHMTLEQALKLSPSLREFYDGDERVKRLIDMAKAVEGMPRNASTHAAGIVVTSSPLSDFVPLAKNDEAVVTQFPMTSIEELGLLKMDFLGLRNLTVMHSAMKMIPGLESIPEDDTATFEMLSAGKTAGVFQLESSGMTGVCIGLKPQSIEDITAVVALFRPGPMDSIPRFIECKHHPERVKYRHELLKPILSVTYGCIVYQEQVLEIFRKLAGFSLGKADMVRRAMSKKKHDALAKERDNFIHGNPAGGIAGAVANGVDEKTATAIFDEIMDFANYAFNKAHAVCYAVIAYQTAYLKCHYPTEYMAALLSSVLDSASKVSEYIGECKSLGIKVLPPDINLSADSFSVAGGNIRFGLVAIKNIGRGLIDALVAERETNGPYKDLGDFCSRLKDTELNKRAVESLIKSGAMDCFGYNRRELLLGAESIADAISRASKHDMPGQFKLFEEAPRVQLQPASDFELGEKLSMEKEICGLYLSGHPLDGYAALMRSQGCVPIAEMYAENAEDESRVTVAGLVVSVKTKLTRNNSMMAYVTIEDLSGDIELLIFERALRESEPYLKSGKPVLVKGRLSLRDEKPPQILAESISLLEENMPVPADTLYLRVVNSTAPKAGRLMHILSMFPGSVKTVIYYQDTGRKLAGSCLAGPELINELTALLGAENIVIRRR